MAVDVWILKFNHSLFQLSDWNLFSSLGLAIWAKFLTIVFLQIVLSVCSKIDLFQVYEQIYELLTNRHFRSRFALCSLWSVIFLFLLCVYCTLLAPPPPPPHLQILHTLLFSNPLGRTVYFQKDMKTIPYAKFAGQTECIMEDSKVVSGKEVRAHPLRLFLIILLYRAMLPWDFFWPRTDESSGVENNSYVHVSERPHSD